MSEFMLIDPVPPLAVAAIGGASVVGVALAIGALYSRYRDRFGFSKVTVAALGVLLLGPFAIVLSLALPAPSLVIGPDRVEVRSTVYGQTIDRAQVDHAHATVVSLHERPELLPAKRLSASQLPGSVVGWCQLRNGERSLVYRGRGDAVAYIPTTEGYSLLLEVEDPEAVVSALRATL